MATFPKEKLKEFKAARNKAIALNKESFWYEGHEYLVSFAKYVIEYLEGQLGR